METKGDSMKIIDIRSKTLHDEDMPATPGVHVALHIEKVAPREQKPVPYELEVGRKKLDTHVSFFHPIKIFWRLLKSVRFVRFTFLTHFGLKKYRVHTSFFLSCIAVLFLFTTLVILGDALSIKESLARGITQAIGQIKNAKASGPASAISELSKPLFSASFALKDAQKSLVELGKIPELAAQSPLAHVLNVQEKIGALNTGSAWAEFFLRVAGFYEPRYYLVLFENNAEIRATGGFIGSYALLKVSEGNVEVKKAEGVFNLSGQQSLLLTPPEAIQKISINWGFHDGNWFFDFPTSANFLSWLYEKNGGPTLNGVIAITPQVLTRMLALTGPVEIKEYDGLTLTAENVIDALQTEVEETYKARDIKDPKEIIKVLTPLLLEKIQQSASAKELGQLLVDSLTSKDALIYLSDQKEESLLLAQNWGGGMLITKDDYLAVVNSNINGYKSDRMISERIALKTEVSQEGDIIDTVTITREHAGGNSPFPWYNKVNADFLRVYVPEGSQLLNAQGQTLEFDAPRIDYQKEHFMTPSALEAVNATMSVDEKSGTRIFQESGKTVFGNWVYVSPGEKVEVTYRYRLPINTVFSQGAFPFTLTVQKQSGISSLFSWNVVYPPAWQALWTSQEPHELSRDIRAAILLHH